MFFQEPAHFIDVAGKADLHKIHKAVQHGKIPALQKRRTGQGILLRAYSLPEVEKHTRPLLQSVLKKFGDVI